MAGSLLCGNPCLLVQHKTNSDAHFWTLHCAMWEFHFVWLSLEMYAMSDTKLTLMCIFGLHIVRHRILRVAQCCIQHFVNTF